MTNISEQEKRAWRDFLTRIQTIFLHVSLYQVLYRKLTHVKRLVQFGHAKFKQLGDPKERNNNTNDFALTLVPSCSNLVSLRHSKNS